MIKMEHIKNILFGLGLTDSTVKTYTFHLSKFFNKTAKVSGHTEDEINRYLEYLIIMRKYKARSRNLVAKIITCYYREIFNQELKLRRAKEDKPMPKICWDEQLGQIMAVTRNIKQRLNISVMRYSGLRVGEANKLKKSHVLLDGRIFVDNGKGQKSRYTVCHPGIHKKLLWFIGLLPEDNDYIFQGQYGGHYSNRTSGQILNNAFNKLGWPKEKRFGCHAMRHAFCVYGLDEKIAKDTDEMAKWLGHSSIRTTQIYTQCRRLDHIAAISRYNEVKCIVR